jgi:hypothetical protein
VSVAQQWAHVYYGSTGPFAQRVRENLADLQYVAALSPMAGCIVRQGRQTYTIAQRPDANGMHVPSICLCPPDQYTGAQNPWV